MAEPNTKSNSMCSKLKNTRKQAGWSSKLTPPEPRTGSGLSSSTGIPCGACKFLRRKCVNGCIFAPYFSPEQGTALFAAVHKVFGASNVSKLLMQLPLHHRYHAVQTILYEAQARLSDPVCGCVSIIIALQQQVAELQMELAMVQDQVLNTRLTVANTVQGSLQQPKQFHLLDMQPVYSNDSIASNNNMLNMNMFDSSLQNLANDHQNVVDPQLVYDPLQFTGPLYNEDDEEETGDPLVFVDQMF